MRIIAGESLAWCAPRVNSGHGFPALPYTTPPRGPCSAPRLRHAGLPGQDEAWQRGARAERSLKGARELLCGVWLPSSRREAPPERSGKLLANVGPVCSAGHRPRRRQRGRLRARRGRDSPPLHALAPAGQSAGPQPFRSWLAKGVKRAPPRAARFQPAPPTEQLPLLFCAPRASVSPRGWAAPPQQGCQAGLSSLWGAGATWAAAGQGGCLTRTAGS